MIRLATVGTSQICEQFLGAVKSTGKFEHSAVYSRNYSTGVDFAEKFGCGNVFCNLEELARSNIADAVYIASPNSLHYSQSKLFLENGKHVICEKPIVTSAEEYVELKKIADVNKVIYMEAIMPLYTKQYKAVHSALKEIGKPVLARIDFSKRSSRLDTFLSGKPTNIFDMSLCAGTLMDLGVYCVYAAVDFFGFPEKIIADAHFHSNGADLSGCCIFEYSGFSAALTYTKAANGILGTEITGENGSLKIGLISQYAGVTLVKDGKEKLIIGYPDRTEIMSGEAEKFADFISDTEKYSKEYSEISEMCFNVHKCMDEIKFKAGIKYF